MPALEETRSLRTALKANLPPYWLLPRRIRPFEILCVSLSLPLEEEAP